MTITLKYFGVIAEELGRSEEQLDWTGGSNTLSTITDQLKGRSATMRQGNFQVAINHRVVNQAEISDGDEIAILPPFSGG